MGAYSMSFTCGGYYVVDAHEILQFLQSTGQSTTHLEGWANSLRIATGKEPGRAWVLLTKADLTALLTYYSTSSLAGIGYNLTVTVTDSVQGSISVTSLCPLAAESVLSSNDPTNDTDDVYLVELVDARYCASRSSVNKCYNITMPEHDGTVYTNSTNGGTPWNWTTLLTNLWSNLPTPMGAINLASASLPSTLQPWNYDFQGWNAWDAIHQVLADIQHHIAPSGTGTFFIEPDSATTAGLAAAVAAVADRVVDRAHPMSGLDLPATVRVFFPRKDDAFQLSATADARTSKEYWTTRAFYTVDVATSSILSSPLTVAGSVQPLHAGKFAEYDTAGSLTNAAALTTAANELATRYLNAQDKDQTHDIFSGFVNFTPSGSLQGVIWYDLGAGAQTEILYHADHELITGKISSGGISPRSTSGNAVSSREGPGPADQARQHLPPDYLLLVELAADLAANYAASATVQYGAVAGGGIAWSDSHAIVVYEVNGLSYVAGTKLFAYFHPQVRKWIVWPWGSNAEHDQTYLVRARYCFNPGSFDSFDLWGWNGSAWADSGVDVTVNDPGYWNFLLPGEFVWARYYLDGDRYDILGSHGLHRTAKIIEGDIDCYQRGRAEVYSWTAYATCTEAASNCAVDVCNHWAFPRDVRQNEEVFIQYHALEWHILPPRRPLHAYAELYQDMCPTDVVGIDTQNERYLDGCADQVWSGTVVNTYSLAGMNGDKLLLLYDSEEGLWHIVQVQHHEHDIVVEEEEGEDENKFLKFSETGGSGGDCAILGHVRNRAAVMYCGTLEWKTQIDLETVNVIAELSSDVNQGCPRLLYKSAAFCAFQGGTLGVASAFFSFVKVAVCTDIYDDGTCVWARYDEICVGLDTGAFALEQVLCGVDCESGSGSGSGA